MAIFLGVISQGLESHTIDMSHILTRLKLNLAYYIMNFDIPKLQKNILVVYYHMFKNVL